MIFISSGIDRVDKQLRSAFDNIKKEFDEHLACINENTAEIQATNDQVMELNSKMEKLNERIAELFLMFEKQIKQQASLLTTDEKAVFLIIYSSEKPITYSDISKKLEITEAAVQYAVGNLVAKGVPIMKKYINNRVFIILETQFKELQAKLDVLNLNQKQLVEYG